MTLAIMGLVVLAALLQRVTGIGFAMMLAPFLVVMIGPHGGVMLTNLLSVLAPVLMMPAVWKDIQWRRLAPIALTAVLVMPPAGWLANALPQGPLYIVVASLVLIGLSLSVILSRVNTHIDGPSTRVLTGVGAGGGVILAGVGGPAMTMYAVISQWDVRKFAATLQPLWVLMALGGFLTKLIFSGNEMPAFPVWFWVGAVIAILAGIQLGVWVHRRVSDALARKVVIFFAFVGALLSLLTGLRETIGF